MVPPDTPRTSPSAGNIPQRRISASAESGVPSGVISPLAPSSGLDGGVSGGFGVFSAHSIGGGAGMKLSASRSGRSSGSVVGSAFASSAGKVRGTAESLRRRPRRLAAWIDLPAGASAAPAKKGRRGRAVRRYVALDGRLLSGARGHRQQEADERALTGAGYEAHVLLSQRLREARDARALELLTKTDGTGSSAHGAVFPDSGGMPEDSAERVPKWRCMPFWGIPAALAKSYATRGVDKLFEWQASALLHGGEPVLSGATNFVYSAPTSGGKTMVAEILMLRALLQRGVRALFVVPYVSVVAEKTEHLRRVWCGVDKPGTAATLSGLVIAGSHEREADLDSADVVVCTIEKASLEVNRELEKLACESASFGGGGVAGDPPHKPLGIVVLDELHMVSDGGRGPTLEAMISKLMVFAPKVQLLGMSATLPDIELVAAWMKAVLFTTNIRPVPLRELALQGDELHEIKEESPGVYSTALVTTLPKRADRHAQDVSGLASLVGPAALAGRSILVFCPTRQWCISAATSIAAVLAAVVRRQATAQASGLQGAMSATLLGTGKPGTEGTDTAGAANATTSLASDRAALLAELGHCPAGICATLAQTVPCGVAYHSSDLTVEERAIVEKGYRAGVLSVLCATSTLAAGVNLPARLVVIRAPRVGRSVITPSKFRQMAGRAGRAGIDDRGEAILMLEVRRRSKIGACDPTSLEFAAELYRRPLDPVASHLTQEHPALLKAVLDVMAVGTATRIEQLVELYDSSLAVYIRNQHVVEETQADSLAVTCIHAMTQRLRDQQFIEISDDGANVRATQLGKAACQASMDPHEALRVLEGLAAARKTGIALDTDLHLLYHLTPISGHSVEPPWSDFRRIFDSIPPEFRRVGAMVGVQPVALARYVRRPPRHAAAEAEADDVDSEEQALVTVHRRFFASLVLMGVISEIPILDLCRRYLVSRGAIQQLQSSAATFSSMVIKFTDMLNWKYLHTLLKGLEDRLAFGAPEQLVPLTRVPGVLPFRARTFFKAGIKSPADLAETDVARVTALLQASLPFQRRREAKEVGREGTTGLNDELRRAAASSLAERIVTAAKLVATETMDDGVIAAEAAAAAAAAPAARRSRRASAASSPAKARQNDHTDDENAPPFNSEDARVRNPRVVVDTRPQKVSDHAKVVPAGVAAMWGIPST